MFLITGEAENSACPLMSLRMRAERQGRLRDLREVTSNAGTPLLIGGNSPTRMKVFEAGLRGPPGDIP